jgi:thioredoxin-dependent peroxiredoxin
MMVMGISRAFPFADNSSNPNARGPFSGLVLRGCCAPAQVANVEAASAQMTAQHHLRYNVDRTGEAPMLDINDKAPDIKLEDENGKEVSLKDFKGKTVVLYFYPRADTPGCTKEACEFRDTYKQMQKTGAVLLGASPDTPKAQKKFQEKFHLPFTLLADADKRLCNAFGVIQEKNMYGKKVMGVARTTFVIGPDGKIKHVFHKVKPEGHSDEVLAYLKQAA